MKTTQVLIFVRIIPCRFCVVHDVRKKKQKMRKKKVEKDIKKEIKKNKHRKMKTRINLC